MKSVDKRFFEYIQASKRNGTLYIGVTNDIKRRVAEHKQGVNEGFTKRYQIHRLVFIEECTTAFDAIAREKQIKSG